MSKRDDITDYFADVFGVDRYMAIFFSVTFGLFAFLLIFLNVKMYGSYLFGDIAILLSIMLALFIAVVYIRIWSPKRIQGIDFAYDIFSLVDDARGEGSVSGSFFLGIGSFRGEYGVEDYYVFYRRTRFGLEKDKLRVEGVTVVMSDTVKPSYKVVFVDGEAYRCLFVPKNTVKQKIKMDFGGRL